MDTSSSVNMKTEQIEKVSLLDRIAKKVVLAAMKKLQIGHLVIEDRSTNKDASGIQKGGEVYHFGQAAEDAEYSAHIYVEDSSAYKSVFFNSSIGAGEAYMQKYWSTPDLLAVIRLMVMNLEQINEMDSKKPIWTRIGTKIIHMLNTNTQRGSKKNISAHYDLGNDFFSLFLNSIEFVKN